MDINKRNVRTWSLLGARGTFGLVMQTLAEKERFYIISADLSISSGLKKFKENYPERLINVGIAEQNLIGVAAGCAMEGETVYATSFAPFITERCLDQIRMNMGYMRLPVKLVGLSSGFEQGLSGCSHYGMEDAAVMRLLHNITVVTPADCAEIVKTIEASLDNHEPMYIRLTGGRNVPILHTEDFPFEIGKGIVMREGADVLIAANGVPVYESLKAAKTLEQEGISTAVINMHTLRPLDEELLITEAIGKKLIVTVEEHGICGGLGTAVSEVLAGKGNMPCLVRLGMPDAFMKAGKHEYMNNKYGLTAGHIAERIEKELSRLEFEGE